MRDLAGQRFGKLLVLSRHERSGKSDTWEVRCDCGKVEVFSRRRLTYWKERVESCLTCRTLPCAECGCPVMLTRGRRVTCSEACRTIRERRQQLQHKRKCLADPAARAARNEAFRAMRRDEKLGRIRRDSDRAGRERRRADAAARERERDYKKRWYLANRERLRERKRAQLAARSDDQVKVDLEQQAIYENRRQVKVRAREDISPESVADRIERNSQLKAQRILRQTFNMLINGRDQ